MKNILNDSKIAVIYHGDYYRSGPSPRMFNKHKTSNFFKCLDNHKNNILNFCQTYDIFFHTYTGPEDHKLVECLSPTRYIIQSHHPGRVNTFKLANMLPSSDMYDYILNLRFDLMFCKPIVSWPADHCKFNTLHPEGNMEDWLTEHKTSDLLYFYPAMLHKNFIQCTNELFDLENLKRKKIRGYNRYRTRPIGWMHWAVKHLIPIIGKEMIHLMYPTPYFSGGGSGKQKDKPHNPIVYINRD